MYAHLDKYDINSFVAATMPRIESNNRPVLYCNDGFDMSVQGSRYHYCSPKGNERKFEKMEIGFPSRAEPLILKWAENPNDPTGTVYGWVPVEIINKVLKNHGGIDWEKTLKKEEEDENTLNSEEHCEVCGQDQLNCKC